jgi:superfamily II DNA or RNA helicase
MNPDIFSIYYGNKTELKLLHHTPDYVQVHTSFAMQMESDTQFHEIKEALYTAENRNKLIVATLCKEIQERKGLIFTEHISHARNLQSMIEAK